MNDITATSSLFEIDSEIDDLLDHIQEQSQRGESIEDDLLAKFRSFCEAHGEKVDRIGRFIRMMESRESYCRGEANRLIDRARIAEDKAERTKAMVMFYLLSRGLKKVEGREFTLRLQKNSQDTVKVISEQEIPIGFRRLTLELSGVLYETVLANLSQDLGKLFESSVSASRADNEAIKAAISQDETVPGVELRRGTHLRVA